VESLDIQDVLQIIKLLTDNMSQGNVNLEFLQGLCIALINKISQVPVSRESQEISIFVASSTQIVTFFHNLQDFRGF
jgi:hypothetical protein